MVEEKKGLQMPVSYTHLDRHENLGDIGNRRHDLADLHGARIREVLDRCV